LLPTNSSASSFEIAEAILSSGAIYFYMRLEPYSPAANFYCGDDLMTIKITLRLSGRHNGHKMLRFFKIH